MSKTARSSAKTDAAYNVGLMRDDMVMKGWLAIDLARAAKVSHMAVSRFLSGERRTPRMAKRLAKALGKSISRYVIPSRQAVA